MAWVIMSLFTLVYVSDLWQAGLDVYICLGIAPLVSSGDEADCPMPLAWPVYFAYCGGTVRNHTLANVLLHTDSDRSNMSILGSFHAVMSCMPAFGAENRDIWQIIPRKAKLGTPC